MDLAWGCAPHSGWAVAVLAGGSATRPVVLDRRRVQLCPDTLPRQAYHAAQGLSAQPAAALVAEVDAAVASMTETVVDRLVEAARPFGPLVAVGVLGRPRDLPALDVVLRNHSLLHAAEGELYRAALHDAVEARGLTVCAAPPKDTVAEAAAALGTTRDALTARLAGLRADLGPPWQADHKAATAAALLALHLVA
jgi:threonine dehydrogenase-like Zn-dependent dehydrogenase